MVDVLYFTDPGCPWSWAAEPALRRIQHEFGGQVSITYVMGGLAREVDDGLHEVVEAFAADLDRARLAAEWRVRPERVLGAEMWRTAA